MLFHDVEQNTDEWMNLRAGKITSSSFSTVMANDGKAFSDTAKALAVKICIERLNNKPLIDSYTNQHMQRGHEQEPFARQAYEEFTFCEVKKGGFFDWETIGCSPDGLIDHDGVIEIKSVIPAVHYKNLKRQSFDPAYKWQLIGNMVLTERKWIDFVSYCADFPEDKKLYVCRLNRCNFADEIKKLSNRLDLFSNLIQETKKIIVEHSYLTEAA